MDLISSLTLHPKPYPISSKSAHSVPAKKILCLGRPYICRHYKQDAMLQLTYLDRINFASDQRSLLIPPERDDDRVGQGDGRAAVQRHLVAGHADAEHRRGHPRTPAEGRTRFSAVLAIFFHLLTFLLIVDFTIHNVILCTTGWGISSRTCVGLT